MKTDAREEPLIAVGGGCFLVPERVAGVSEIVHVRHQAVANAVGAAIAQVSGEVDQIFQNLPRETAIAQARHLAEGRAVSGGADAATLQVVEVEDLPLAYLPGNSLRVRVRVVGDIRDGGQPAAAGTARAPERRWQRSCRSTGWNGSRACQPRPEGPSPAGESQAGAARHRRRAHGGAPHRRGRPCLTDDRAPPHPGRPRSRVRRHARSASRHARGGGQPRRPAAERRSDLSRAPGRDPFRAHVDRLRSVLLGGRHRVAGARRRAGRAGARRHPGQRAARRGRHAAHARRADRHVTPERLSRGVVPAPGALQRARHNNRNHRRILVVDGRVGITGGSGVSDKWTGDGQRDDHWRDTDVRIEGPAVTWLQAAFVENWRVATGELLGGREYVAPSGNPPATCASRSCAARPRAAATPRTRWCCSRSSRRGGLILMTNPYFVLDSG